MTCAEERNQEKEIINELAEQIALAMDWELMVDPQPLSDRGIIRKGNKSLYFRLDWRDKSRLNISGSFEGLSQYLPLHGWSEKDKTEITVFVKKPIEKIVKDIQNRLLPGYERMLAHALEMKAKDDGFLTKKKAELEEIAGLLKEATIQDEKVYTYEPTRIDCRWWGSDGTWDLTAKLTKEKLKAVLAVINE